MHTFWSACQGLRLPLFSLITPPLHVRGQRPAVLMQPQTAVGLLLKMGACQRQAPSRWIATSPRAAARAAR